MDFEKYGCLKFSIRRKPITIVIHLIYYNGRPIGNHNLLKQSPKHIQQSALYPLVFKFMLFIELRQQIAGTLNRPRHQLRKKHHKQRITGQIFLNLILFIPIDVYCIAKRLKRIKGNANRKHNVKFRIQQLKTIG